MKGHATLHEVDRGPQLSCSSQKTSCRRPPDQTWGLLTGALSHVSLIVYSLYCLCCLDTPRLCSSLLGALHTHTEALKEPVFFGSSYHCLFGPEPKIRSPDQPEYAGLNTRRCAGSVYL